jgi:hypothetical protein
LRYDIPVPAVVALSLFISLTFQPPDCGDVTACRQAALDAQSRGEFELFHDLAWRTVQKGRRNDPDLMILVARAQSLSGRPGDALVMLRRLAQMGVPVDVGGDDFRRVRDLPAWSDVAALFESARSGDKPAAGDRAATEKPAKAAASEPAPEKPAPEKPAPEKPAPEKPEKPAEKPAPEKPAPEKATKKTDVPPEEATPAPPEPKPDVAKGSPETPGKPVPGEEEALPDVIASLEPAGLAYDGVSRRFIVGDRRENKLVVFDDVFKRATNMVGAGSAGFFGLTAIEIDAKRGDLWITNSGADRGSSLHKLQLVSGRVLFEISVPAELGPTSLVDAAVLDDGEVLLLDAEGRRILRVQPSARSFKRAAAVDVEGATSIASNGEPIAYVAHRKGLLRVDLATRKATPVRGAPSGLLRIRSSGHGLIAVQPAGSGHRIVRLRVDASGNKMARMDVLAASTTMPDATALTVADGVLYYLSSLNGGSVLHRTRLQR